MAYIPDDAIEDASDLSAPAWLLYCNLCRRRNHRTGTVIFSIHRTVNITGRSRSAVYKALQELESKGWIQKPNPHTVIPIYGNFEPVNRRFELSPERDFPSTSGDKKSRKTRQPYKEEPALPNPFNLPNGKTPQNAVISQETAPCSQCQGKGWYDPEEARTGTFKVLRVIDCERCNGSGLDRDQQIAKALSRPAEEQLDAFFALGDE